MKIKIGIIGKAGRSYGIAKILAKNAGIVGREISKSGCILVTGACMGVADIAARSASKAGGIVLAYSPAKNIRGHKEPPISYPEPRKSEILILTGSGKIQRNVLSIQECDGVIVIGGGIGTLNEFSIAYHEGKIIGVLDGVGGVVEKILKIEKDLKKNTGKSLRATILKDRDPKRLVKRVIREIKSRQVAPRKEIPVTFKNQQGKELAGILHLPKKEKPGAVIICHSFQGTKTKKKYVRLARRLQKQDVLVFRFDFEGCGDSEGDPKNLTIKNEVFDLEYALKAVMGMADINPRKIAFVGDSLGAVISAMVAKTIDVKTLIFWNPAFCQKLFFKKWYSKEDKRIIKKTGVLIKKEKEIGKKYYLENKNKDYSKILSELNIPILIIQSEKDDDVPLEYSLGLARRYKNITLKILKNANHKIDNFLWQKQLVNSTIRWVKKYL